MSNEEKNELTGDRKRLAQALREGLGGVRSLFVAITALVITLAERRPKPEETSLAIKRSEVVNDFQTNDFQTIESANQMKSYEVQQSSSIQVLTNYIYPFFAAISTVALIVGVSRLAPIAEWARNQNACIERTLNIDGSAAERLSNQVKNCNGGHD